ncbi:DsbA family protein [Streptomyces sp. NPDC008343]|uniref:DsbA family protein n=1 Tax=Streptomyces sp. NPDC008343 TaxID=3364828 RepID=UPI0036E429A5
MIGATAAIMISGCAAQPSHQNSGGETARLTKSLPVRLDKDGVTVVVGHAAAKNTVRLYEEPRCPDCRQFEQAGGQQLRELADSGKLRIEYVIASFLDERLGGEGSARAANALRASVNGGAFLQYHDSLYEDQMDERIDGYTTAFLLKVADNIKGLHTPGFHEAVKQMKYRSWVGESQALYAKNASHTPTAVINGVKVDASDPRLYDSAGFSSLLKSCGVK